MNSCRGMALALANLVAIGCVAGALSSCGSDQNTFLAGLGTKEQAPPVVVPPNLRPTANAGLAQTVDGGDVVTLDGSGSTDPEGAPLTYLWTQTGGGAVTLSDATAVMPTFVAPAGPDSLEFSLIVNDGTQDSFPDMVTITVNAPPMVDLPPVADAGSTQTVPEATSVTLDGTAFRPEGAPLTYAWTQTGGALVTLSNPTSATPSFTAPAGPDTLVFELVVNDGTQNSAPDSVTINVTVVGMDMPPTADAGPDQTVNETTMVTLDGTGSSDPEGAPLTYAWTQTGGTATVMLSDPTVASPTFTAPAAPDTLIFELIVDDGGLSSTPDTVTITVTAPMMGGVSYSMDVHPIWAARNCTVCHDAGAMAGGLDLSGTPAATWPLINPPQVDLMTPANSLIITKPLAVAAGGVGHGGGDFFMDTTDPDYQLILQWITEGALDN